MSGRRNPKPVPSLDEFVPRLPEQPPDESPDLQYNLEELRLKNEKLELENEKLAWDNRNRIRYASRLWCLMVSWLIVVLALIVVVGIGWLQIANSVLITLISGTTVNVLALFGLVAKYLFRIPRPHRKNGH